MKTKSILLTSALATTCIFSCDARANVAEDWRKIADSYLSQNTSVFNWWRGLAMVHVAEFDAIHAVFGGYTPYAMTVAAPGASPEAAAVQAAYSVLTNISRVNISTLNSALAQSLAAIPDGPAKEDGIRLGKLAAEAIIQLRAADDADLSVSPTPSTAVGRWRPAPPDFTPGAGAQLRYMTPWTMKSPSQFRPGPPPALNSAQYATDYNEVRLRGSSNSTNRTDAEALSAQSRDEGLDFLTDVIAHHPLPLLETARVFALLYMALADDATSAFEAKYVYNFWRPITAIREGASDGNDATPAEPAWTPFLPTHPHPEYPSLLCQNTAAMIEVLISIYGDDFALSATWPGSNQPRIFQRLSDVIQDAVEARVSAGIHFRNSCNVAVEVGRRIAQNALQNFLRPVPNITSGGRLKPGEFQLNLTTGRVFPYVIETSSDLIQWLPWQTNIYGTILQTDSSAAVDHRFYRTIMLKP